MSIKSILIIAVLIVVVYFVIGKLHEARSREFVECVLGKKIKD